MTQKLTLLIVLFSIFYSAVFAHNEEKIKESGYTFSIDAGTTLDLEFGYLNGGRISLTTQMVHGYQINRFIYAGLGVGLDYYSSTNDRFIPMFVSIGGHPLKTKVSPYYQLDMGYSQGLNRSIDDWGGGQTEIVLDGGFMYNASIGAKIQLLKKASALLLFGYKHQVSSKPNPWDPAFVERRIYNRFFIKVGLKI